MVDFADDAQGGCPGAARGLDVACAVLGIAQVVERIGFVETIREFPVEGNGPLVARDGSFMVAELIMNVPKAVAGSGLPVALAQLPDRGQRLLTVGEDHRLAWPVHCRTVQIEGLHGVAERISEAPLPFCEPGQAVAATANSSFPRPGFGLATCAHRVPFQCTMRVLLRIMVA